jgi:hypothetical protein
MIDFSLSSNPYRLPVYIPSPSFLLLPPSSRTLTHICISIFVRFALLSQSQSHRLFLEPAHRRLIESQFPSLCSIVLSVAHSIFIFGARASAVDRIALSITFSIVLSVADNIFYFVSFLLNLLLLLLFFLLLPPHARIQALRFCSFRSPRSLTFGHIDFLLEPARRR